MIPKHIKKVDDNRKAHAPYNFVELPSKVVKVSEDSLPSGNRYYPQSEKQFTGKLKCILTTESPLYIRCGLTTEEFKSKKEAKDLPEFFYTESARKATKVVIPGSSLRGMIRTLVEIVSFSKIERVTKRKPFFRTLVDKTLQEIYAFNFIEKSELPHPNRPKQMIPCYQSKVRTGFLRRKGSSYIIEECPFGRIDRKSTNKVIPNLPNQTNLPVKPLYDGRAPLQTPSWVYQNKTIYVEVEAEESNHFFKRQVNQKGQERHPDLYLRYRAISAASFEPAPNLTKGTLVITGNMKDKHLEFVFLDKKIQEFEVEQDMIARFQDDDQITKWQEDAFKKDKPSPNCRQKDGYIRDGEPVFFLLNNDQAVHFFGRAQMFRLPYDLSPFDLVPEELRNHEQTDIAEAVFGYVNGQLPRSKARASRVLISNANCISERNIWWRGDFEKTVTPKILGSPKPTTFQHYLVQGTTQREQLRHYSPQSSEKKTIIRGHKFYWHKGNSPDIELVDPENKVSKSQKTNIKPIKKGISFSFDIDFENLSDVELGVLLWVLSLGSEKSQQFHTGKADEKYCFSLGMGKPLGMGAVKIDYELCLSDRTQRYQQLFDGASWDKAESLAALDQQKACIDGFERFILSAISEDDHPEGRIANCLNEVPRIEMLLAMLRCDAPTESTEYMALKDYTQRKVLPTPIQIRYGSGKDYRRLPQSSTSSNRENQVKEDNRLPPPITKPKGNTELKRRGDRRRDSDGGGGNPALQRPSKPKR